MPNTPLQISEPPGYNFSGQRANGPTGQRANGPTGQRSPYLLDRLCGVFILIAWVIWFYRVDPNSAG
jgi:hypothetical protein